MQPLTLASFPRAIIHIDADAFFAACEQAADPALKGKPVITGRERSIASAVSYEAKALGIKRGMSLREIKAICPHIIHLPSDYETYSLYSKRMFAIVRRYTDLVEEYSIDECFAEITGLRRPLRMNYETIARTIKETLDRELGMTFSIGLAPTKVVAKMASKWDKPSGFVMIPGKKLHEFLGQIPIGDVWGIGPQTMKYLEQYRLTTALHLAREDKRWIKKKLTKPHQAIYEELRGNAVIPLELDEHHDYQSISKTKTFTPPRAERAYVLSQLSKNVENACIKARRHQLATQRVTFLLRTQDYQHSAFEIRLNVPTVSPSVIIKLIDRHLDAIFQASTKYRLTGVVLSHLSADTTLQYDLFGEAIIEERTRRVFSAVDAIDRKYGKHTVYIGTSHAALTQGPHHGERADQPRRQQQQLKGETKRQRLNLPLLGEVK